MRKPAAAICVLKLLHVCPMRPDTAESEGGGGAKCKPAAASAFVGNSWANGLVRLLAALRLFDRAVLWTQFVGTVELRDT